MELIFQNDGRLSEVIQKVGCFIRSCGACAELHEDKELTAEQINSLLHYGRAKKIIDNKNNLLESAPLMTKALRLLGNQKGYFAEVGIKRGGKISLYPWAEKRGISPDTFIQKIRQNGPNKYHFRVVNRKEELVFDPHNPEIKCQGVEYTICYKYMEK